MRVGVADGGHGAIPPMTDRWAAVLWDIGGVILDPASVTRARELFLSGLSVRFDFDVPTALDRWKTELGAYFSEREGRAFRPAHAGYVRTIDAIVGDPVAVDEWFPVAIQAADHAFRPTDGVVDVLSRVADEGYYLGVVSDIDTWEAEFILTTFGIRDRFDHVTTSQEVGRTKPAPEIFETALSKCPAPAAKTLYVGDRYEHDMRGAAQAGMDTVAFNGSAADAGADDPHVGFVADTPRDLLEILNLA